MGVPGAAIRPFKAQLTMCAKQWNLWSDVIMLHCLLRDPKHHHLLPYGRMCRVFPFKLYITWVCISVTQSFVSYPRYIPIYIHVDTWAAPFLLHLKYVFLALFGIWLTRESSVTLIMMSLCDVFWFMFSVLAINLFAFPEIVLNNSQNTATHFFCFLFKQVLTCLVFFSYILEWDSSHFTTLSY